MKRFKFSEIISELYHIKIAKEESHMNFDKTLQTYENVHFLISKLKYKVTVLKTLCYSQKSLAFLYT